jgi:hypothetical protein
MKKQISMCFFMFMLCILKDINNILFHLYGHEKFDINNDELWGNYTNIYKKGEGD